MTKPNKAQPDERERQNEALKLKVAGMSYERIAAQLGYADKSGAFRAVEAVLNRQESHAAESLRQIEDARLDVAVIKVWPGVVAGDPKAIELWAKLHDRRVRLHGLAMPEKLVVAAAISSQQSSGMTAEEFRDTVMELRRTHPAKPRPDYVTPQLKPGESLRWEDEMWELGVDPSLDVLLEEDDGTWANT